MEHHAQLQFKLRALLHRFGQYKYSGELDTGEGMKLVDDLASFRVPSLLFSGGEPLMRKDLFG